MRIRYDLLVLWLFLGALLFIGPGTTFNHQIAHEYPYGLLASDAFQHQIRAEFIKDQDSYKTEAPYTVTGEEGIIGYYQPILFHLSVLWHHVSGLPLYDLQYLLLFVFSIIGIMLVYDLIRQWSQNIAYLSIPFMLLFFSGNSLIGFRWGHWPAMLAGAFLLTLVWAMPILLDRGGFVLLAILMSALIMTHGSEFVFGIFVVIGYVLWRWIFADKSWKERLTLVKPLVFVVILTIIISGYSYIILSKVWLTAYPYEFKFLPKDEGFGQQVELTWWILVLIGASILLCALTLKKKMPWPFAASCYFLVFGYLNVIGFGVRAFTMRFWWPVMLSVFFGFLIYFIYQFFSMKSQVLAVGTAALLSIIAITFFWTNEPIQGLMDKDHWDTFAWVAQNTPANATVFFLYNPLYAQDAMLRNVKRFHVRANEADFVGKLQNGTISRYYEAKKPGDWGPGLPYRTGPFSFGTRWEQVWETRNAPRDLCAYDIIVLDVNGDPQLKALYQYQAAIGQALIKHPWIKPVYQNDRNAVLQNTRPGEECIAEVGA